MTTPHVLVGDIYDDILIKFGYPRSRNLRDLVELVFTVEEAEVFLKLPASPEEIAEKLKRETSVVIAQLDNLASMGVIKRIQNTSGVMNYEPDYMMESLCDLMMYSLAPEWDEENHTIVERGNNRKIADIWHRFFEEEWYRFARTDELIHRRVEMLGGAPAARTFTVTPAWKALEKSGIESPPDPNYDLRHMAQLVKQAGKKIVAAPCSCKVRARQSEAPIWTCGSMNEDFMPRYWVDHPREIYKSWDPDEWLEMMGVCEQDYGLVHVGLPPFFYDVCTCDTECCNIFKPLRTYAHTYEGVEKSPFQALVDEAICEGHKDCAGRCRFEALTIKKNAKSGKSRPVINTDRCTGCGQCVLGCQVKGALKLVLRPA